MRACRACVIATTGSGTIGISNTSRSSLIGSNIGRTRGLRKGLFRRSAHLSQLPAGITQPFPKLMGVDVTSAEKSRVTAQLLVRPDLCTSGLILHGGAIMAFADTLGAIGAFLNLPEGAGTTTIESKTNF